MKSLLMLLSQLGFDEAQSQLFTEIASTGPLTVLELSRTTNIKRTTVHFHVEQLISKGLVTEGVRRGRRVLVAVNTDRLAEIVEVHRMQVAAMEKSLARVLRDATEAGTGDQSYGVGFVVEDGVNALERIYKEALESGEVLSYLDVAKLDGLHDIRMELLNDISLRSSLYSFKELFYARDPGQPEYVKKLKAYKPFQCIRSSVKLSGNVVNILVFEKTVAFIVRDTEWKVIRVTQGLLAPFVANMLELCMKPVVSN
ncbi:MAG: helix-turn-helix domain-containing protein [Patescibacteria group bacterium]